MTESIQKNSEESPDIIPITCNCDSNSNKMNMIFSYGVGSKNILNTYQCTYTKDMIIDSPIMICLQLTEMELDSIYEKMIQIDFFSYPDTFEVIVSDEFIGIITPFYTYKFYVQVDTNIKELYWADEITNPDHKADKLRELNDFIIKIIESKEEYQDLPPPKGVYI